MTTLNAKHLLGIDLLRFIAACLVVAFHFCFLMGVSPGGLVGSASQRMVAFPELYASTAFGWVGVQIFFVISGFVIAFSGEKATAFTFFKSRVVRLGPSVWICAPISLVATMLVGFRQHEEMMRAFRHSMLFFPWAPWIDGSYWTLGIEISFYFLIFALIVISSFTHIRKLAIAIGMVSSAFWLAKAVPGVWSDNTWHLIVTLEKSRFSQLLLIQHGLFFAIGVLLWSQLVKKHKFTNVLAILFFCVVGCIQIAVQAVSAQPYTAETSSPVLPCLIWVGSVCFIVWSVRSNAAFHRAPLFVKQTIRTAGMMTYPLYLLHQIVGAALMGWMVSHGVNRWSALFSTTIGIFLATWLIAKHIEPSLQKATGRSLDYARWRYRAFAPTRE